MNYQLISLLLAGCLSSFLTPLSAQTKITGIVLDEQEEALSYAGIMLLNASDSLLVKGDVSTDDGSFTFKAIPPGNYLIGISLVGYNDFFSPAFEIAATEKELSLGTYRIAPNTLLLEEVEVVARRPLFEQRIDRLVVNVAQSITAAGGTALEVLERSPGIIVNRQTNSIAMSGKSGVVLMINNKINRLPVETIIQMLDGMPAANIERIEIITTPPANFDAEGNAGILSIILKKNQAEGLNGSINASVGYGAHEKYGSNINFNYRKGRVNLFGDYGYDFNHTAQVFTNYRSIVNDGMFIENDNISRRDPITQNYNGRLGLDINLSDKTVVGVLGTWGKRDWNMNAVNTVDRLVDQQLQERLIVDNQEINIWKNWLANFNLQHQFSEKSRMSLDLDYTEYDNDNPTDYVNRFFDPQGNLSNEEELRVGKKTPIGIYVGKLDYATSWGEKVSLEAGVKGTFSEFENDFSVENLLQEVWVSDDQYTAAYLLEEKIGAAYGTASWQITPKTGIKAGLRYEYTDSNLGTAEEPNIIDREYGNWFPSIFLTQELSEDKQLQVSYSRRINRPAYTDLAPFVIFFDPNTLLSGNVALQPAYTDAYRVGYRHQRWFFSLDYGYTDQAIARFQPQVDPETNQQINTPLNMDFQQNLSLSVSFPVDITEWWSMRYNLVSFWQNNQLSVNEQIVNNEGITFRGNTTQTFNLPWEINLEVTGFFMSPAAFGLIKSKPFGDIALGLQKNLGDKAGSIRINVANLLEGNFASTANQPDINLNYRGKFAFAERRVRLTYTYNFGSNKVKAARNRQTGSSEEQGRINN